MKDKSGKNKSGSINGDANWPTAPPYLYGLKAQLSTLYYGLLHVFNTRVIYIPRFYRAVTGVTRGRMPTLNLPYAFIGLITSQNMHLDVSTSI